MWAYNHGCIKISAVEFCLKILFFALIAEYLTDQLAENAKLCTFATFHLSQQRKMLNFAHLYLSINPCTIKLMI